TLASPLHSFPGVWPAPRAGLRLISDAVDVASTGVATVADHLMRRAARSVMVLTDNPQMAEAIGTGIRQAARGNPTLAMTVGTDESGDVACRPLTRWSGDVRDRVVWVRDPDHVVETSAVATVLSAARRSVTVLATDHVGPEPEGHGARMLEQLLQDSWAPGEQLESPTTRDVEGAESAKAESAGAGAASTTGGPDEPAELDGPATDAAVHPLVDDLRQRLEVEGYVLQQHVGHGPHAVPLAIEDPNRPGRLLVAVDLDVEPAPLPPGRDSTRLRVEQLSRLGWTPVRVLSTNLFRDPAREVAALVSLVREAANRTTSPRP
ncbi:MAG: hypothetical protein WA892_08520, partial [Ornithinimicrobium sp.]